MNRAPESWLKYQAAWSFSRRAASPLLLIFRAICILPSRAAQLVPRNSAVYADGTAADEALSLARRIPPRCPCFTNRVNV